MTFVFSIARERTRIDLQESRNWGGGLGIGGLGRGRGGGRSCWTIQKDTYATKNSCLMVKRRRRIQWNRQTGRRQNITYTHKCGETDAVKGRTSVADGRTAGTLRTKERTNGRTIVWTNGRKCGGTERQRSRLTDERFSAYGDRYGYTREYMILRTRKGRQNKETCAHHLPQTLPDTKIYPLATNNNSGL